MLNQCLKLQLNEYIVIFRYSFYRFAIPSVLWHGCMD